MSGSSEIVIIRGGGDADYISVPTNGGREYWPNAEAAKARLRTLDLEPGETAKVLQVDPSVANSAKVLAKRRG